MSSNKKDGKGILSFILLLYFVRLDRNSTTILLFWREPQGKDVCSLSIEFYVLNI